MPRTVPERRASCKPPTRWQLPVGLPDAVHLGMADEQAVDPHTAGEGRPRPALGRITRVILKNYKSIVSCDVELQPLTILVGPNGSGKSNFLDALAFVKEALTVGLEQAIRNRGNVERILSAARAPGDDSFYIEVQFQIAQIDSGFYSFGVGQMPDGDLSVVLETAEFDGAMVTGGHAYPQEREVWTSHSMLGSDPDRDSQRQNRLLLARDDKSGRLRPAYDLLTSMAFYNPLPDGMRDLKRRDLSPHLLPDGSNVATMLRRMQAADPDLVWGIEQYMKRVLPGLEAITTVDLAGRDLLQLSVTSSYPDSPHVFDADQLSDGTLRALAILVALFQHRLGGKSATSLVGIEEPENNIHPAAARILLAAMQDSAYDTQVLVTTHSADMLHMGNVEMSSVLVVSAEDGVTKIGPIDAVSQSIVRDNLYTVGELLQMNQLFPEPPTGPANGDTASHRPVAGRS